MKIEIEISEDDLVEIMADKLKADYEELKVSCKLYPKIFCKKDVKALKRVAIYCGAKID